jgi:cell division protein FtsA
MLSRFREKSRKRHARDVIAVLDVGSTKICCLVAVAGPRGEPRILGVGHHASDGIRSGAIADLEAASNAIGQALQSAERRCHEATRDTGREVFFDQVMVSLSASLASSHSTSVEVPIHGHEVKEATLSRALSRSRQLLDPAWGETLHMLPLGFSIDGRGGIRDPRGMFGNDLTAQFHAITSGQNALRNLEAAITRWQIDVEGFCVGAYASAMSCLVDDEMDLGCTLIDLGGGTTSFAVFAGGSCVHVGAVPVGGAHVTHDIALGLTTSLAEAERLKVLHGSAIGTATDLSDPINVPQIGEGAESGQEVPKSLLTGIIQPRIEETFELVRARLEAGGFDRLAGRRVVLTGGASQLPGMREMAQLILDKQVRLGRPAGVDGLPDSLSGPGFATALGLLSYAGLPETVPAAPSPDAPQGAGMFSRMAFWLKENL